MIYDLYIDYNLNVLHMNTLITVYTCSTITVSPTHKMSLIDVLTFVASSLDIYYILHYCCVLSYFDERAHLHGLLYTYQSVILSLLNFDIIKYLQKCKGCTHVVRLCIYTCVYIVSCHLEPQYF